MERAQYQMTILLLLMIKRLLKSRAEKFNENIGLNIQNNHRSPIYEILKISYNFGIYNCLMKLIFGRTHMNKNQWKFKVWEIAWKVEESYWNQIFTIHKKSELLHKTLPNPGYLTWWHVSDLSPDMMRYCEDMAKLVCGASRLKCDDFRTRNGTFLNRACSLCDSYIEENPFHIVMQCPIHEPSRRQMYDEIGKTSQSLLNVFTNLNGEEKYLTLMGKSIVQISNEEIFTLWKISGFFISSMYRLTISMNDLHSSNST